MIAEILSTITNFIVQTISSLDYAGIFFLMALQSAAVPIPSEITMPFSGFLVSQGRFIFWAVVLVGALGNLAGAVITYYLGRFGGRPLFMRYGKYVLVSQRDLALADKFFERFGVIAILVGRCIPVVSTFISIPAGIAKVKLCKFIIYTFVGALVWNFFLSFIGLKLGENWQLLREKLRGLESLVVILIVAGAGWWVWRHLKNKRLDATGGS